MKSIRWSALAALLLFASSAVAGTIKGTVTDGDTHEPLVWALVIAEHRVGLGVQQIYARSDAEGAFSFSRLEPDTYVLRAVAKARCARIDAVTLTADPVCLDVIIDRSCRAMLESDVAQAGAMSGMSISVPLPEPGELGALNSAIYSAPGTPSWHSLGGVVYFSNEVDIAERAIVSLDPGATWFPGTPSPTSVGAIPLSHLGARLALSATTTADPDVLAFTLTLSAGDRPLQREVQHRGTNVSPFLFAFTTPEGAATTAERGGTSYESGAPGMIPLVAANASRTWSLRVTSSSLGRCVPANAQEMLVTAAFSELQHNPYYAIPGARYGEMSAEVSRSNVLVRSEAITLVRNRPNLDRWVPAR